MQFSQSTADFPMLVTLGEKNPFFGLNRFNKPLRFVPLDEENFTLRGGKQRLLYKGKQRSHQFTILGDKSFEYDCILLKPPDSNVISLLMEGAENYDFFRQPEFVKDPFLKGSYAVYKKETLIGEGTGKLCHIHRPEIIDARGRRCWGNLSVIGNMLRITIPEKWLGEAAYPVIVDPTIGTTTVGSQASGADPDGLCDEYPVIENQLGLNKYLVSHNGSGLCTAYIYTYHSDTDPFSWPCLYTNDEEDMPYLKKSLQENTIDLGVTSKNKAGWRSGTFSLDGSIVKGSHVWFGLFASWFTTRFDYGGECYKLWPDYDAYYPEYDGELPPYVVIHDWDTFCDIKWSWYFTYTETASLNHVVKIRNEVQAFEDPFSIQADYLRNLTQTVKANSTISRFETFFRKCVLTVHSTMNVNRYSLFVRTVADLITSATAHFENRFLTRQCTDGVDVNSKEKRIFNAFRKAQDAYKAIDHHNFSVLFIRSVQDNSIVSDKNSHLGSFIRGLLTTAGSAAETSHKAQYYRFQKDKVQAQGAVFRGLLLFVRIITKVFVRDYLLRRFLVAREELALKSALCREITLESRLS